MKSKSQKKPIGKRPRKSRGWKVRQQPVRMPIFDSMAQCAARTGIPMAALRLAKKSGSDAFTHGRVDLDLFIRWWFATTMSDTNWSEDLKKSQALTARIDLAKKQKQVIDFDEVRQFINKLVAGCFFAELDRLAQEFPPGLKGKTEMQVHAICARENEKIKATLRKQLDIWKRNGK